MNFVRDLHRMDRSHGKSGKRVQWKDLIEENNNQRYHISYESVKQSKFDQNSKYRSRNYKVESGYIKINDKSKGGKFPELSNSMSVTLSFTGNFVIVH